MKLAQASPIDFLFIRGGAASAATLMKGCWHKMQGTSIDFKSEHRIGLNTSMLKQRTGTGLDQSPIVGKARSRPESRDSRKRKDWMTNDSAIYELLLHESRAG